MKNNERIKRLVGVSILIALAIALTLISNYIPTGVVNINLVLIVIAVGACLYGPWVGLLLGLVNGVLTIIAPATLAYFFSLHPLATILLCLLKTGLAGFVAGWVFKLIKKKSEFVATVVASLLIPIINTGLFILGVIAFFLSVYGDSVTTLLTAVLTLNFLIEFLSITIISPVIYRIIIVIKHRYLHNEDQTSEDQKFDDDQTSEVKTSDDDQTSEVKTSDEVQED